MSAWFSARGLCAGYGESDVLREVALEVRRGEIVAVIGANGAGKSTLMLAIMGLLAASAGTIELEGRSISGLSTFERVRLGVALVPERRQLFGDMTVEENLLLGGFSHPERRTRSDRLAEVFDLFPRLAERKSQRARTLSGGERRMLALGRGLMSHAELLMIDEPSLGLAPVLVDEVYHRIATIARGGQTILLVEENFAHVKELADTVVLMENGTVVKRGSVEEVLNDRAVVETYLGIGGE